ncbi:hypothetical protein Peur_055359 [Populus x canadensis]
MDNLSGCQKWSPLVSCCWVDAEVPVSNGFHWISATKVLPKLLYLVPYNFGTAFHDGKKIQLPSFRDCLKEGGTVKKLAVGREAAIEVQDMKADEFLLFLAVTCEGTRVWCWGYTLLFTNFVSRLARVHDAFTWPTCATVSVSEQLHHLHATSPSQDNSYDVKRVLLMLNFFHVVVLQESLLAMSKLREEVDLEKSRAKWDSADRDKD